MSVNEERLNQLWCNRSQHGSDYGFALQTALLSVDRVKMLTEMLDSVTIARACDNSGMVVTTLRAWLREGKKFMADHSHEVRILSIIDLFSVWMPQRQLWTFYWCHTGDVFDPEQYTIGSSVVPAPWSELVQYNRINTDKLYHDDVGGMKGWDSSRSAKQEVEKAALEWALRRDV